LRNCSRSTRSTCNPPSLDLRSVGPRTPPLCPHPLSSSFQLAVICVSVPDHISSLLCPTTARRQLIGPGILPEENTLYSINARTKYCTSSPDSALFSKYSTFVKPLSDLPYLSFYLNGPRTHIRDMWTIPLRDAPVRRPDGYRTKFTGFISPLLFYG
jgi:hypothetical protein